MSVPAVAQWFILINPDKEGTMNAPLRRGPVLAFTVTAWFCELASKRSFMRITQIFEGRLTEKVEDCTSLIDWSLQDQYRPCDEAEIAAYLL